MLHPKNVYIVGAQSTGKTTLLNALQKHYTLPQNRPPNAKEPAVISEVARGVLSDLQIDRNDIAHSPEKCWALQNAILNAQASAESSFAGDPSLWYISDRSGVDPIVYARLYAGEAAAQALLESAEWKALEGRMKRGLVVLCESGGTWLIDDGTRLMPRDAEEWTRTTLAFQILLRERGLEFVVVPKDMKDIEDRVALVVREHNR